MCYGRLLTSVGSGVRAKNRFNTPIYAGGDFISWDPGVQEITVR